VIAVLPVRSGALPAGGAEAAAAAGGRVLLVGGNAPTAAADLTGVAREVRAWDTDGFAPGRWARALAPLLADCDIVLLPASPDGRDLAPRLAAELDRPLHAGAVRIRDASVTTVGFRGSVMVDHALEGAAVVTLQPGVRGVEPGDHHLPEVELLDLHAPEAPEPRVLDVLGPDVATMDLAEAPRILGGGAGLDGPERYLQLARVAARLDASVGTTRVITDRGWLPHSRQIGTTGVVVEPRLYMALGISGAVQHTSGLGRPDHVVSVNTEAHCPMMDMADLAIVADANATLEELEALLGGLPVDHGIHAAGGDHEGAGSR